MCVGRRRGRCCRHDRNHYSAKRPHRRTQQANPRLADEDALNAFLGQIVSDLGASLHVLKVGIGDKRVGTALGVPTQWAKTIDGRTDRTPRSAFADTSAT